MLLLFMLSLSCSYFGTLAEAEAAVLEGSKPHIVFILFDDIGYNNVEWHSGVEGTTPHLLKLAEEGIVLTRHYSYKMCAPSRSSIQSGRNPLHCTLRNDDVVIPGAGIAKNMTTMAAVLKRAGYSTVFAGKWDAGMATPRHTPKGRGYDSSLLYFHHCVDYWTLTPSIGCPAQTPMLPPPATGTQASGTPSPSGSTMEPIVDFWDGSGPSIENGTSECGREDQPLATCDCSSCSHCSNASDYYNGVGRALLGPFKGSRYVDDVFAARAVSEVRSHNAGNATSPLFLFFAPHAAHTPLQVPQVSLDRFASIANPWRRTYTAMVWHADQHVGDIRAALEENENMWGTTLVVFASDNGGPVYNNGTPGANNYPLKGGKMSNWDGGIRVPCFVSGGAVPLPKRGTTTPMLSALWDWYATFAYLAGLDPTDATAAAANLPPIDSINLAPALLLADDHGGSSSSPTPRTELAIGTDVAVEVGVGNAGAGAASASATGADGATDVDGNAGDAAVKSNAAGTGARAAGSGKLFVQGLIRGRWKLLVGELPMSGWQGISYPNASTHWIAQHDVHQCTSVVYQRRIGGQDAVAVDGGGGKRACLFDIDADPTEHTDVSGANPDVVTAMLQRMLDINSTAYTPDRGVDEGKACKAAFARGRVWGPFTDMDDE